MAKEARTERDELALSKLDTENTINLDRDDAGRFISHAGGAFEYSAKEANVVRWKLDLILLPMVSSLPGQTYSN